jgi:hypothetical protein
MDDERPTLSTGRTLRPTGSYAFVQYGALAGAIVAILAQLRLADGFNLGVVLFAPWVLLPFAMAYLGVQARPESRGRALGLGLASAFGILVYLDLLLSSRLSSTAGLAFIFVPLWQSLGSGVVLALTFRRASSKVEAG